MPTDPGVSTPEKPPHHDPYETGREWPIDALAGPYGLDPAELRRALNLAAAGVRFAEAFTPAANKVDLERSASAADALAAALERAAIGSVVNLLLRSVADPSALFSNPEVHRRASVAPVRALANRAHLAAGQLHSDPRAPNAKHAPRRGRTAPPDPAERTTVHVLADLWRRTHGQWPKVSSREDHAKEGRPRGQTGRKADRGGEFVIKAAELVGLQLTPQRLRTVLNSLRRPEHDGSES